MDLPTPETLKRKYLFGVPLTDSEGNTYADEDIQTWIDQACSWIETELQIKLTPTEIQENHDYYIEEYSRFCYIHLYQFPVISVQSLKAQYGGQDVMSFPVDWIKIYKNTGQLQLVPTNGSLAQVLITQGSSVLLPILTNRLSYMPYLFQIAYTAGFDVQPATGSVTFTRDDETTGDIVIPAGTQVKVPDTSKIYTVDSETILEDGETTVTTTVTAVTMGTASNAASLTVTELVDTIAGIASVTNPTAITGGKSEVPGDICDIVGMRAAIGVMNVMGDILLGIGLTNSSLSLDGVSQSTGYSRSSQGGLLDGRVKNYTKMIESQLPNLKEYYKGIRLVVV